MRRIWLVGLLLLVASGARADSARLQRLSPWARQTIELRRAVRGLQREGRLPTAHPAVASRLSAELTKSLGREVRVPARRIVQVQWGSAEHHALRKLLGSTVGIGVYPSRRWGHSKLRIGDLVTDAVPRGARPFPSTGTRARLVPMEGMHQRFYEAVFVGEPGQIKELQGRAAGLVQEKRECGMGCTSFVSRLLREQLKQTDASPASGLRAYGGKLEPFKRSESSAGPLWKKAAGADPALIIVYTPPGDYRSVKQPGFKFDYAY